MGERYRDLPWRAASFATAGPAFLRDVPPQVLDALPKVLDVVLKRQGCVPKVSGIDAAAESPRIRCISEAIWRTACV